MNVQDKVSRALDEIRTLTDQAHAARYALWCTLADCAYNRPEAIARGLDNLDSIADSISAQVDAIRKLQAKALTRGTTL